MENILQTEKVMLKKEKASVNLEQIVENDISLPDYFGDIVKILGTSSQTNVYSASVTGDKATLDGNILVRVLYVDGNGKTEIIECASPFNRSVDVKDAADGDLVDVKAVSEQISCRAVNQRRADIRGSVTLRVTVTGITDCNVITQTEEGFCHTLRSQAQGSFLLGCMAKSYTLNASEELTGGIKEAKIYRAASQTVVTEVRTIKNKMMIKGSVSVDAVLLSGEGNFVTQRMSIPVNQICDMDGIDEDTQCCVSLKVKSLDLRLTPDSPQSPPNLEAAVIISAETAAYKKTSMELIAEAYSPSYELLCQKNTIRCVTGIHHVNENYTVSAKMDFSSCKAKAIADTAIRKVRYSVFSEEKTVVCKGNLHFGIVVITQDNEKLYFERIADFTYQKQINDDASECEFAPEISVNGISCSAEANGEVSVAAELRIDGFLYLISSREAVTYIEKGKEKKRGDEDGVITLYYAAKGERLWDIAKAHGSSVERIQAANELSEDILSEDRMLIFEQE